MEARYRTLIANEFRNCVTNTINRLNNGETNRPFHSALLSDEALFWSRFERSFSTSFGQRVVEEVSKMVAIAGNATDAMRQKHTEIHIDASIDAVITNHMNSLRAGVIANSWIMTLNSINSTPLSGRTVSHQIISDLWWLKDGINHYMSIKTVKPNIDVIVN